MKTPQREVYFNEYNIMMSNATYLPIVSGLLQAYAASSEELRDGFKFMPFLFHLDNKDTILGEYRNPAVAAFSLSMWNEQLNIEVAEGVKASFPDCLVVFGGPQVPHHPQEYFEQHPFIDVAVRAEGEEAFAQILTRLLTDREFGGIPGIAWRDPATGACIRNDEERPQSKDLDLYPSPYLEGIFDDLMERRDDLNFQAIIETNRGCPFPCTFCFWGQGGLSRKYRFHGIDRVAREIEWCAQNKIQYMFNADSNFGMHRRDADIAQILVETKKKYGYPEKFRTCWGKNTDDKIYNIAMLLHDHDMEKGITLSRQSNDEGVLDNIRRKNIKLSTYRNLQERFNENDVPVYSELILGLPGETYQTWTAGIEEMLQSGLKNQLFVYFCQVFPNTELADPLYMKKYGIVTQRVALTEIHGSVRKDEFVTEYEDLIITTNSMDLAEWRRMAVFSWTTMLLHSLKLGYYIMLYMVDRYKVTFADLIRHFCECRMGADTGSVIRGEIAGFETTLNGILAGKGRGHVLYEFGDIYWDEEEASFLRISDRIDLFYGEMLVILREFLHGQEIPYDGEELAEAVRYQRLRIPTCLPPEETAYSFSYNFPEYFETHFTLEPAHLQKEGQELKVFPKDYRESRSDYARQTILWGRKSGAMLTDVEWNKNEDKMSGKYRTRIAAERGSVDR
jgi:radical SAM superfamily enzyme YgiQ (UPF0313 family)